MGVPGVQVKVDLDKLLGANCPDCGARIVGSGAMWSHRLDKHGRNWATAADLSNGCTTDDVPKKPEGK